MAGILHPALVSAMLLSLLIALASIQLVQAVNPTFTYTSPTTINIIVDNKNPGDDFFGQGSNGLSYYLSDASTASSPAPKLVVTRGVTYTFISQAPAHPFYITDDSTGAGLGNFFMNPIGSAGVAKTWVADPSGTGTKTLYYQCDLHAKMGNSITIVPAAGSGSIASSTAPAAPSSPSSTGAAAASSTAASGPPSPPQLVRPANISMCDFYTAAAGYDPTKAADEFAVLKAVLTRSLLGSNTSTPNVVGLANDPFNAPFFTKYVPPGPIQDTHISHVAEFFGMPGVLNCTAPGYPAYQGNPDMKAVHLNMKINTSVFNGFVSQAAASAKSFGFNDADISIVAGVFNSFLRLGAAGTNTQICNQPDCACLEGYGGVDCAYVGDAEDFDSHGCLLESYSTPTTPTVTTNPNPTYSVQLMSGYKMSWSIANVSTPLTTSAMRTLQAAKKKNSNRKPIQTKGKTRFLSEYPDPELSSQYEITMTLTGTDLLPNFQGYLGFGFGTTMVDADLIVCFLGSTPDTGTCQDAYTFYFSPQFDVGLDGGEDNIRDVKVAQLDGGRTSFTFKRYLITFDQYDYQFPIPPANLDDADDDFKIDIIFSHGPNDQQGLVHHGSQNRGKGNINFYSGGTSLDAGESARARLLHGCSMLLTWLVLYPCGAFVARYLKHWYHWLTIHQTLQTAGSVGCVSFAVMALVNTPTKLMTTHSCMGIAITSILVFQIAAGEFSKWRLGAGQPAWWHRPLAKIHKYVGFFLVTIGPYQVSLGIDLLWPGVAIARQLYWAVIGLLIATFITAETYKRSELYLHEKRMKALIHSKEGEEDHAHPALKILPQEVFDSLPYLTWMDISSRIASGSKLLVISGIVVDVRAFAVSHPGGSSVLEDAVGTDATLVFHGLDPEAPMTHAHSNQSWKKLATLALALLQTEENPDNGTTPNPRFTPGGVGLVKNARNKRLNQIMHDRRVPLTALGGESAHYRRYRLIHRCNIGKNVIKMQFEQINGLHPRPFVWKRYFAFHHSVMLNVDGEGGNVAAAQSPMFQRRRSVALEGTASLSSTGGNKFVGVGGEDNVPETPVVAQPTFAERAMTNIQAIVVGNERPKFDLRRASIVALRKKKWGQADFNRAAEVIQSKSPPLSARGVGDQANKGSSATVHPVEMEVLQVNNNNNSGNALKPVENSTLPEGSQARLEGVALIDLGKDAPASVVNTARNNNNNASSSSSVPPSDLPKRPSKENAVAPAPATSAQSPTQATLPLVSAPNSGVNSIRVLSPLAANTNVARAASAFAGAVDSVTANILNPLAFNKSRPHFLLPGEHVEVQAVVGGEAIARNYTPVPFPADKSGECDTLELVIKVYPKGQMSNYLSKLKKGEYLKIRGPLGDHLMNRSNPDGVYDRLLLVAGGAGLTPFLGVIHHYLCANELLKEDNSSNRRPSQILLLFCNSSIDDVFLQDELNDIAAASNGCFQVQYVYSKPPPTGKYKYSGRISTDIMRDALESLDLCGFANDDDDDGSVPMNNPPALNAPPASFIAPATGQVTPVTPESADAGGALAGDKSQQQPRLPSQPDSNEAATSSSEQKSSGDAISTPLLSNARWPAYSVLSDSAVLGGADSAPSTIALPPRKLTVDIAAVVKAEPTSTSPKSHLRLRNTPSRVIVCGPIDFSRAVVGALDDLHFDMENLDVM